MRFLRTLIGYWVLAALIASPLVAQQADEERLKKLSDAHRGDFDYLLGDWEFSAVSQQYGKFSGRWSAVRVGEDGPILDEYRVVGDDGSTWYVTQTLRSYNARHDQWDLVSTGGNTGLENIGRGQKRGGEMFIEQNFGPSTLRIRYYNIGPDHFSWIADRSLDNGKTWTKDFQKIEARRIAPARSVTLTAKPKPVAK